MCSAAWSECTAGQGWFATRKHYFAGLISATEVARSRLPSFFPPFGSNPMLDYPPLMPVLLEGTTLHHQATETLLSVLHARTFAVHENVAVVPVSTLVVLLVLLNCTWYHYCFLDVPHTIQV